jgi:hypothetical protein
VWAILLKVIHGQAVIEEVAAWLEAAMLEVC